MSHIPHSTLEQWSVLRAVVAEGGFAQAAEALHRSQSSVSYAIAKLQETLGVSLLELQGRRSVLTPAGSALLAATVPLIDELQSIEERSKAIASGEAVSITLVVDSVFPRDRLFDALETFAALHPYVEIHLREAIRQSYQHLRQDDFDIAILMIEPGAPLTKLDPDIPLIAVAQSMHPLAELDAIKGHAMLARHVRVDIRALEPAGMVASDAGKIWRMNTVDAAISAVKRGLCYGWLPEHLISKDLDAGTLVRLPLEVGSVRHIPLGLLYGSDASSRHTVQELAALLSGEVLDASE